MADIKTLLGDAYKEGMTVEEINSALSTRNLVDPATLPKSVEKSLFDKQASQLAAARKELEDLKKSGMTDDEKMKKAIEDANAKEKEYLKKLNRLEVEKLFVADGLKEEDYKDLIDDIISDDAEKTTKFANNLLTMIKNQKSATEQSVRAEVQRNTPRTPSGTSTESGKDYAKMIEEAQMRGDFSAVAYYTRLAEQEKQNNS